MLRKPHTRAITRMPAWASIPNYIWSEAGSNLGVTNDNPPFGPGGNNQTSTNLSALLQSQGTSWKSYQEDINLATNAQGNLTSTVLPKNQWTVVRNGRHEYALQRRDQPALLGVQRRAAVDGKSGRLSSPSFCYLQTGFGVGRARSQGRARHQSLLRKATPVTRTAQRAPAPFRNCGLAACR
jgi:hypothetical protein